MANIYGEDMEAAPEPELVVPDYNTPAPTGNNAPTAMSSMSGPITGGSARSSGGALEGLTNALYNLAPLKVPAANENIAAVELAALQTIVQNIQLLMCLVFGIHMVAALTVLDEGFDAFMLTAYCILSLGALGHFGSKHRDQFLLRFYAFFAVYWALFMGVAVVGGISTLGFNKPTESEIADCDRDPLCDHDEFHREKTHPIAEFLPNLLLLISLVLGAIFGWKLSMHAATDDGARAL